MAKQDRFMQGRNEGMDFALRIAEAQGVDGLRKEVASRGITGCGVNITHKDLQEAGQSIREYATMVAIAVSFRVMKEHFFLPPSQMERFVREYTKVAEECIDNPERLIKLKEDAEGYGVKFI